MALLSGGLDSAVSAAIARAEGYAVCALSFDYGQRHRVELERAARIAASLGAEHRILRVDLAAVGGSALTGAIPVPRGRTESEIGQGIPPTYVPARNTIFLALALGWAEILGAFDIFLGVNSLDYSGYPDCRPEFVAAFEELANVATAAAVEGRGRFRVHAPLLRMTKAGIVRKGIELGLDLSLTWSCYDPQGPPGREVPCGACDSCTLRRKGFAEAGVPDAPARPSIQERP